MRYTSDATLAMKRVAEVMGWTVEYSGTWVVLSTDEINHFTGLRFTATALLCTMVRILTAPEEWGGCGWQPHQVRSRLRFEPDRHFDLKRGVWYLDCNGTIAATDEVTMQIFLPHNDDGEETS